MLTKDSYSAVTELSLRYRACANTTSNLGYCWFMCTVGLCVLNSYLCFTLNANSIIPKLDELRALIEIHTWWWCAYICTSQFCFVTDVLVKGPQDFELKSIKTVSFVQEFLSTPQFYPPIICKLICIVETWLCDRITDTELGIPNY